MGMPRVEDLLILENLARDKTASGREILVTAVGDLFTNTSKILSDRERALMSEILRRLVSEVETSVRRMLAEQLVDLPNVPHDLLLMLANDEAEVAYPLLVNSGELKDLELIEIVRNRTLEHQLAIAIRRSVSEQVSDALVATGNVSVVTTLLKNEGAEISKKTLEYLVEESQRVDQYQGPLLNRRELSEDLAQRMYRWVSDALRTQIQTRFKLDPALLDAAVNNVVEKASEQPENARSKAAELADQLYRRGAITPGLLLNTLREGEVPLFTALLARFTSLRTAFARRLIFEPGGQSLSIVCKASGIDRATFSSIYLLTRRATNGDGSRPISDIAAVLSFYDRISPQGAAGMLRKWQSDPETGASDGDLCAAPQRASGRDQ
jgi:uncharacterized protein (DUF2336 family)